MVEISWTFELDSSFHNQNGTKILWKKNKEAVKITNEKCNNKKAILETNTWTPLSANILKK